MGVPDEGEVRTLTADSRRNPFTAHLPDRSNHSAADEPVVGSGEEADLFDLALVFGVHALLLMHVRHAHYLVCGFGWLHTRELSMRAR